MEASFSILLPHILARVMLYMKRYYSFRVSYLLLTFFLSAAVFAVCSALGAVHAVTTTSVAKMESYPTVILDAGHGGEDGGAVGVNGAMEKDINLLITLLVREKLEKAGIPVQMIRETDTAVGNTSLSTVAERKRSDIQYRAEIVNQTENCILVSIHQNFFEQSQYSGAQMFYSQNHADSSVLAESIRSCIVTDIQPDNKRENKPAEGIYLLSHVNVPAVIVECGFLSNPEEAAQLTDPEYQEHMAAAIAEGIIIFCSAE